LALVSDFYDRAGNPLSLMEWCEMFEARTTGDTYHLVALSTGYGYRVSTVWTGIDYSFGVGPPLYYETMIFNEDGPAGYQVRHGSEEEAIAGHKEAVKYLRYQLTIGAWPTGGNVIQGEVVRLEIEP
jgi:hypothetical protein